MPAPEDAPETVEEIDEVEEVDEVDSVDAPDGKDDKFSAADKAAYDAKLHKVNRESQNLRNRLKEATAAVDELAKIKDSQKSDSERLTDRAAKAEEKAAALQSQLDRVIIKQEFGLTDAQAKRLVGTDLDSLREDAEELKTAFSHVAPEKDDEKPAPVKKVKAADVNGGKNPADDSGVPDIEALMKAIGPRF